MIVFHSYILKFLQLFLSLLFSLLQFQVDSFFFFFFPLDFSLLLSISHIQFRLVLFDLFQFKLVLFLHLKSELVLHLVLFQHCVVVLLFLFLLYGNPLTFLFNQFLHLSVHNFFFFQVLVSCLALQLFSVYHLRFEHTLIFTFSLFKGRSLPFSSKGLGLSSGQHFSLLLRIQRPIFQGSNLSFGQLFGSFFGHVRNFYFFAHGLNFRVCGDDVIDLILLELIFKLQFFHLLCQELVRQLHYENQFINKIKNFHQYCRDEEGKDQSFEKRALSVLMSILEDDLDIILIETIMAHEIPMHGGKLITQIISSIHIHTYLGKELTFVNTIIMQSRKLIAPNVAPIIHEHPHPQNAIGTCPFAIINEKYVKEKDEIFKLLRMLIDISYQARNAAEEDRDHTNQINHALTGLLQMCEELSEVATVLNEEDINPFYLFMNPILKFREYRKMEKLKLKLHLNTQFIDEHQKLNTDHFLYKLHMLEEYIKQLQRKRLSIIQGKFVKICIIGLLKHFAANNKKIFEAALQHEEFQRIHSRIIEHITDLSQYQQKLVDERRQAVGAYATFNIQQPVEEKKAEDPQTFRQKITQALIKPVTVTIIFVTLYRIFSN